MSDFLDDAELLEVARDVGHRWEAYGQYGSRERALKALRRRAPGREAAAYGEALDGMAALYRLAKDSVARHHRPGAPGSYARFEDVDLDAVLADLDAVWPGNAGEAKRAVAGWSVFYWVLK